jgi:tetratricopeptide (TPR) repeat protein
MPTVEEQIDRATEMISQRHFTDSDHLLDQVLLQEQANHRALYCKGVIRLHWEDYDSALYFLNFARSSEPLEKYSSFIQWTRMARTGDAAIRTNPGSYQGYIQKSQGLASMELYELAQVTLNKGLEKNPNNLNLILAKALVWVQSGQTEQAKQYLLELEQQGLVVDPALKERIFLQQR